jgi:hypothetical protein
MKVVAARIISDVFHTDLHATKNVDKGLGASYSIVSAGTLAPFTDILTVRGEYLARTKMISADHLAPATAAADGRMG